LAAKWALALFSPLVVLGLLEAMLRLMHFGLPTRFLISVQAQGQPHWVNNPFFGYRFFSPELARNPSPIAVERDKPANVLRIAVLGESAAQGDPMLDFGMPRLLEKILGEAADENRVEVINAAMTAINSHVIVEIARDLERIRPDVVIVYMGNNEVIGPYGPGTIFSGGTLSLTSLRVRLTRLRLAQLLRVRPPRSPQKWAGLDMFAQLHVPEQDPRLETMYRAYQRNLESIVATCRGYGARVLLSTVAVNLSDCPPFGSAPPEEPTASALVAYSKAQAERAAGNPQSARELFGRARDMDTQRFRADSRHNQIIRSVAQSTGTELVDAAAAFDSLNQDGNLFLDHVHFTFEGTWQLARLFAAAVRHVDEVVEPDLEACRHLTFFSPYAERQQASIMRRRRQHPPFSNQEGNPEQVARLLEIETRCAAQIASTPLSEFQKQFVQLQAAAPRDWFLAFQWGGILCAHGKWATATPILLGALQLVPMHFEARVAPAMAACRIGEIELAARILVGPPSPHGRYLAENALSVIRSLESARQFETARQFRNELLQMAPRFPLSKAIAAYPIGKASRPTDPTRGAPSGIPG
jgi:lysophospholipase L1-like esterase